MLTPQEKKKLVRLVYVSENNIGYGKAEEKKEKKRKEERRRKIKFYV
jgi:hypothetical protein